MGTAAVSAVWIGSRMPRRSSCRPTSGEITVSTPAPTSQTAPMAAAPQPAAASWSGARVERTPNRNDGRTIRSSPPTNSGSRSARRTAAREGTSGGIGSIRSVQTANTTASPASAVKTTSRPMSAAAAPTTGPSSAPNTAAPMAVPITSPRRSPGTAASSHANAPAHVNPLPTPCRKRAAASGPKPWAKAKPRLARPINVRPTSTARRAPRRAAAAPPGSPPTSAPAA